MEEEQKPDVAPEVQEVANEIKEATEVQEQGKERSELNYKMELERRKAETDRLRQELEVERNKQVNRRDQNDLSTWSDLELKAVANNNSPEALAVRDQVNDILLERKVKSIRERERMAEKRATSEVTLRTQFPDAMDPYSEFSAKMEQVMFDYDLQKSPAGRLAAAKIVAAEYQKGSGKTNAAGRKAEEARLKDVKQTLPEGDRPDPRQNLPSNKKADEQLKTINNRDARHEDVGAAMGELLKQKGMDIKTFFGR